jgi:hypothetical protein
LNEWTIIERKASREQGGERYREGEGGMLWNGRRMLRKEDRGGELGGKEIGGGRTIGRIVGSTLSRRLSGTGGISWNREERLEERLSVGIRSKKEGYW